MSRRPLVGMLLHVQQRVSQAAMVVFEEVHLIVNRPDFLQRLVGGMLGIDIV